MSLHDEIEARCSVLIDTWWNVNRIEFVQNLVCNAF